MIYSRHQTRDDRVHQISLSNICGGTWACVCVLALQCEDLIYLDKFIPYIGVLRLLHFLYSQELMVFSFAGYILLVVSCMGTNYYFSFFCCVSGRTRLHSIWHQRSNIRHGSIFFFWFLWETYTHTYIYIYIYTCLD